jgi:hypothetical protein
MMNEKKERNAATPELSESGAHYLIAMNDIELFPEIRRRRILL